MASSGKLSGSGLFNISAELCCAAKKADSPNVTGLADAEGMVRLIASNFTAGLMCAVLSCPCHRATIFFNCASLNRSLPAKSAIGATADALVLAADSIGVVTTASLLNPCWLACFNVSINCLALSAIAVAPVDCCLTVMPLGSATIVFNPWPAICCCCESNSKGDFISTEPDDNCFAIVLSASALLAIHAASKSSPCG